MAAKKILMPVGDFVEDYEAVVPFQILQMVGHTVHSVCPEWIRMFLEVLGSRIEP